MWVLLGCVALSLCVCLPLFRHYKPLNLRLGACFKSLGTLCAMVPALVAALRLDSAAWFFVLAVFLQALGDYLLEFWFETGMGAFLLGHLCYIVIFLKLFPVSIAHLVLAICFLASIAYVFHRHKARIGKNMLPFAAYGIVLCLMAACGIAGGISAYSLRGWMIALGVSLFFFSDYLLFHRLLFPNAPKHGLIIMITYYMAQLLLGGSCLF